MNRKRPTRAQTNAALGTAGFASYNEAARKLGISARTLRRRVAHGLTSSTPAKTKEALRKAGLFELAQAEV